MTKEELIESLKEIIANNSNLYQDETLELEGEKRKLEYAAFELEEHLNENGINYKTDISDQNDKLIEYANATIKDKEIAINNYKLDKETTELKLANLKNQIDAANSLLSERKKDIEDLKKEIATLIVGQDDEQIDFLNKKLLSANEDISYVNNCLLFYQNLENIEKENLLYHDNLISNAEKSIDECQKTLQNVAINDNTKKENNEMTKEEQELLQLRTVIGSAAAVQSYLNYNYSEELANILTGLTTNSITLDDAKTRLKTLNEKTKNILLLAGNTEKEQKKQNAILQKDIKKEIAKIEKKLNNDSNYVGKKDVSSEELEINAIDLEIKENENLLANESQKLENVKARIKENKKELKEVEKQRDALIMSISNPNGSIKDIQETKKKLEVQIKQLNDNDTNLRDLADSYAASIASKKRTNKSLENNKKTLLNSKADLGNQMKAQDEVEKQKLETELLILNVHDTVLKDGKKEKFDGLIAKIEKGNKNIISLITKPIKRKFEQLNESIKEKIHKAGFDRRVKAGILAGVIGLGIGVSAYKLTQKNNTDSTGNKTSAETPNSTNGLPDDLTNVQKTAIGAVMREDIENQRAEVRELSQNKAQHKQSIKSIDELAHEIFNGNYGWGNGQTRKDNLYNYFTSAGYNDSEARDLAEQVQDRVNELMGLNSKNNSSSNNAVVNDVQPETVDKTKTNDSNVFDHLKDIVTGAIDNGKPTNNTVIPPILDLPEYGSNQGSIDNDSNDNNYHHDGGSHDDGNDSGSHDDGDDNSTPEPDTEDRVTTVTTPTNSVSFTDLGDGTTVEVPNMENPTQFDQEEIERIGNIIKDSGQDVQSYDQTSSIDSATYDENGNLTTTYTTEVPTQEQEKPGYGELIREAEGVTQSQYKDMQSDYDAMLHEQGRSK